MSTPGYALPTPHLFDQAVDAYDAWLETNGVEIPAQAEYRRGLLHGLLMACVIQMCDEPYEDSEHGDILASIREQVIEASHARRGGGA